MLGNRLLSVHASLCRRFERRALVTKTESQTPDIRRVEMLYFLDSTRWRHFVEKGASLNCAMHQVLHRTRRLLLSWPVPSKQPSPEKP